MLHSAILYTLIKLPFSIKTFVYYLFKWLQKTGYTVFSFSMGFILDSGREASIRDRIVIGLNNNRSLSLTLKGRKIFWHCQWQTGAVIFPETAIDFFFKKKKVSLRFGREFTACMNSDE